MADSIAVEPICLEGELFAQVLALHRANKQTLGFLPDAGFKDRASAGTLLGAIERNRLLGYVLFDLPGNRVKIVHLCVDQTLRRGGIARLLVDRISARHGDRLGIELACRRDYDANGLWPRLGFVPTGDRVGGSDAGHLLTVWLRDHGHPDLFTALPEERQPVALDQMVFEDLSTDKPHAEESRNLLDPWVGELIELCITDQVQLESNECEEDLLRAKLMASASRFRHLRTDGEQRELISKVAALAPRAGVGDHRHVALARAGGARVFLTRDGALLAAGEAIAAELAIELMRPEQLIDELDRSRRHGLYEPIALQGTDLSESRLDAAQQDDFSAALLNTGARERAFALLSPLRTALADPGNYEVGVIRDSSHAILAGFIRRPDDGVLRVERLRVAAVSSTTRAIARQLVYAQRKAAADRGLGEVVVEDPNPSAALLSALESEGFERHQDAWRCTVQRGIRSAAQLPGATPGREDAAALERTQWPAKITGAGIPTFMISIKHVWAERLFDSNLAAQTLLPREPGLGLTREHVYYRSPRGGARPEAPGRILWYVTGGSPGHEVGHLRAVSQLGEVLVAPADHLHNRFAHLGVWGREQVRGAADRSGQVMALRFSDTELFELPLDLDALRSAYAEAGAKFLAPRAPVAVDEPTFSLLYGRSSRYAD
jgi:hypothetical protein